MCRSFPGDVIGCSLVGFNSADRHLHRKHFHEWKIKNSNFKACERSAATDMVMEICKVWIFPLLDTIEI